jgi:hypothetical protein
MKKTVYLHVGTFKTGTSSIQSFLVSNAGTLEQHGYFVPRGQLIGHHELPLSLIKDFSNFRAAWPGFQGDSRQNWENILEQINKSPCDKVIISSENFCDFVNEHCRNASEELGAKLQSYLAGYDVKVIVYIRPIDSCLNSMCAEIIKNTPLASPDSFFRDSIDRKSIHLHPSTYLNFFSNLFGKDALIVKKYARDAFAGGTVVADFLETIGISAHSFDLKKLQLTANPSIPKSDLKIKRLFNLAGIQGFDFNQRISNILIKARNIISEDCSSDIRTMLAKEISAEHGFLQENYNIDLGGAIEELVAEDMDIDERHANGFLIALTALAIGQNRDILAGIQRIEAKLDKLLSN